MCLVFKVKNPDRMLAEGEHCGFEWAVVHNGMGYRCGYVKVEPGHPWHGKDFEHVDADVHGGLTFAEADTPCDAGGEDDGWWLGFDCAHGGDLRDPALPSKSCLPDCDAFSMRGEWHAAVRTQEYVEAECRKLCEQAAAAT